MKNILFLGFSIFLIVILIGCEKEQLITKIGTRGDQEIASREYVVYANLSCTTADGVEGCECVIVKDNDDCSLQTSCASSGTYREALNKMFTFGEIQERSKARKRITEPELIEALIKDGFPLKKEK